MERKKEIILQIKSSYYTAGAVFKKIKEEWMCIDAAPIIKWMKGKKSKFIFKYLKEKSYSYEIIGVKND